MKHLPVSIFFLLASFACLLTQPACRAQKDTSLAQSSDPQAVTRNHTRPDISQPLISVEKQTQIAEAQAQAAELSALAASATNRQTPEQSETYKSEARKNAADAMQTARNAALQIRQDIQSGALSEAQRASAQLLQDRLMSAQERASQALRLADQQEATATNQSTNTHEPPEHTNKKDSMSSKAAEAEQKAEADLRQFSVMLARASSQAGASSPSQQIRESAEQALAEAERTGSKIDAAAARRVAGLAALAEQIDKALSETPSPPEHDAEDTSPDIDSMLSEANQSVTAAKRAAASWNSKAAKSAYDTIKKDHQRLQDATRDAHDSLKDSSDMASNWSRRAQLASMLQQQGLATSETVIAARKAADQAQARSQEAQKQADRLSKAEAELAKARKKALQYAGLVVDDLPEEDKALLEPAVARTDTQPDNVDLTQLPSLPDVDRSKNSAPRGVAHAVVPKQKARTIGRYKQTNPSAQLPFLPNGYTKAWLTLRADGIAEFELHFGPKGQVVQTYRMDYKMGKTGKTIILGSDPALRPAPAALRGFSIPSLQIGATAVNVRFPLSQPFSLKQSPPRLMIGTAQFEAD